MSDKQNHFKEILAPLYFEAGAGLYDSQTLEYGISLLLFLLSDRGLIEFAVDDARAIIEGEKKKTIGQVLHIVKQHVTISSEWDATIQEGLQGRNRLVHGYLINNIENFLEEDKREQLIKEVRAMRRAIQAADKAVRDIIGVLVQLYGVSLESIQEQVVQDFGLRSN